MLCPAGRTSTSGAAKSSAQFSTSGVEWRLDAEHGFNVPLGQSASPHVGTCPTTGDGSMAETSLHRELKAMYAGNGSAARREVRWGNYRIDVVTADELVEIQHGSLAAIRGKGARVPQPHPGR